MLAAALHVRMCGPGRVPNQQGRVVVMFEFFFRAASSKPEGTNCFPSCCCSGKLAQNRSFPKFANACKYLLAYQEPPLKMISKELVNKRKST
jgi:hypothetical protein